MRCSPGLSLADQALLANALLNQPATVQGFATATPADKPDPNRKPITMVRLPIPRGSRRS